MAIFNWKPKLVLPTVYDDALSYQEILGKIMDELNRIENTAPQFSLEGTTLTITLPE